MQKSFPNHQMVEFGCLTDDDISRFQALGGRPFNVRRRKFIRSEGLLDRSVYLLIDGWAASSMLLEDGRRQIMRFYLPGDIMGCASMCMDKAADTLTALTPNLVRQVPMRDLAELMASSRRMSAFMLLLAQKEQIALMTRMAWIGRSNSTTRVASFLLDIHARLHSAGMTQDDVFPMPLTQEQIGDHLGLTLIHVNRTLQQFERDGLISRGSGLTHLCDVERLKDVVTLPIKNTSSDLSWLVPRASA